jgi:hypothetical protein
MTWIYRCIVLFIVLLVGWNVMREKRVVRQMAGALVLIPLILRMLLIK